jgi:uncharacterized membrane protein
MAQDLPEDAMNRGSDMATDHPLSDLTRRNIEAIARMDQAAHEQRTFGERVADLVGTVVGSWPFIVLQTFFLILWVILNIAAWVNHWDPYPFILLNLVLSFQAAYTSPIIMMSQNRQAKLNERRNHLDLQINMLAEQENTEMLRLLRKLCTKAGIRIDSEPVLDALAQATEPENLVEQMEQSVEGQRNGNPQPQRN